MKVKILGVFVVKAINDEYIEMDAYETGNTDVFERRQEQGTVEYNSDGSTKDFDGYNIGCFLRFNGEYEVERSNEVFTKVNIDGQLLSFPNHKLSEVK